MTGGVHAVCAAPIASSGLLCWPRSFDDFEAEFEAAISEHAIATRFARHLDEGRALSASLSEGLRRFNAHLGDELGRLAAHLDVQTRALTLLHTKYAQAPPPPFFPTPRHLALLSSSLRQRFNPGLLTCGRAVCMYVCVCVCVCVCRENAVCRECRALIAQVPEQVYTELLQRVQTEVVTQLPK